MRGAIGDTSLMRAAPAVEDTYGFVETKVVSFDDLYAGKLHAALDRQHPRDLFDIILLYENEGLTDELFRAFLIYIACSSRPTHELLAPNEKDIAPEFETEFAGMSVAPVAVEELTDARSKLIADIQSRLKGPAAEFLMTLQAGDPDFTLIGLPQAADLPAIKWKILNLKKLMAENPEKNRAQTEILRAVMKS